MCAYCLIIGTPFDCANVWFYTTQVGQEKAAEEKGLGDKHHASYVTRFQLSVEQARSTARAPLREHSQQAFDNYVRWFIGTTRVEICPPAYNEDILEEPVNFEDLSKGKYNRDVRLG